MTKNLNYMIDFLGQIKILQLKLLKLLKIPGFQVKWQPCVIQSVGSQRNRGRPTLYFKDVNKYNLKCFYVSSANE